MLDLYWPDYKKSWMIARCHYASFETITNCYPSYFRQRAPFASSLVIVSLHPMLVPVWSMSFSSLQTAATEFVLKWLCFKIRRIRLEERMMNRKRNVQKRVVILFQFTSKKKAILFLVGKLFQTMFVYDKFQKYFTLWKWESISAYEEMVMGLSSGQTDRRWTLLLGVQISRNSRWILWDAQKHCLLQLIDNCVRLYSDFAAPENRRKWRNELCTVKILISCSWRNL